MNHHSFLRRVQYEGLASIAWLAFALVTTMTYGAEMRLFSIAKGDATVKEWNPITGSFQTNLLLLTGNNEPMTDGNDLEFDGTYFYTLAEDGPFIRRFDASGMFSGTILLTERDGSPLQQKQIGLAAYGGYFYTIAALDPRIRQFDAMGLYLKDTGVLHDELGLNVAMKALATDGRYFYTIAAADHRIGKWDVTGRFIGEAACLNRSGNPDANNTGIAIQPLPPLFSEQPNSAARVMGTSATFQVSADGFQPVSIQWYFNGSPIPGATLPMLELQNVQPGQWGQYFAVASNIVGVQTSRIATLFVTNVPVIVQDPVSVNAVLGGSATLSVEALSFEGANYQWFYKGRPILEATGPALTLESLRARSAGSYHVEVSNSHGTVPSHDVELRVYRSVKFVVQPKSATVRSGRTITLRSRATGAKPLIYQWLRDGAPIPDATSPKLVLPNVSTGDSASYAVVVSNVINSTISAPAVIVVQ